eukprot:jgi/Chrzof1/9174/Cz03g38210.t1
MLLQQTKGQWPYMVFMDSPYKHGPDDGSRCNAVSGISFNRATNVLQEAASARSSAPSAIADGTWFNSDPRTILKSYSMPYIRAFEQSVPMHDMHVPASPTTWDCLHYCSPGLPQVSD